MNGESRPHLNQALEAIQRADFPQAIEILSELVRLDPGQHEAWRELGVCYLETRQPDLALEALRRSLKANPADAVAHYLLGHAYGSAGQLESAAACYRRALELDPRHAKAEEFLIKTESLLESREHYRNALKLLYLPEPSAQDLNRAARELVQSIAIFDASPARDNLGECASKLLAVKTEKAIPFHPAAELEPWIRACERGELCLKLHNWLGARAAYDEALSYRVQDPFVHHALGFCFVELGELHDAVRAWLRVLELSPEYDFTCFGRVQRTP